MAKKKFTLTRKQQITIGIWLVVIGVAFLTSEYFIAKKLKAYDTINFELSDIPQYLEEIPEVPDENLNDIDNDEFVNQPYFVGRLEIPKINLIKGFTAIKSPQNNVNRNIEVMKESNYPDVDKGNFIISGHNGTGAVSYFRNLHKLKTGNIANVYYKGYIYKYSLINIYDVKKTGKIRLYRDLNKTTLTLITCKTGNIETQQTVYVFSLISKEAIQNNIE